MLTKDYVDWFLFGIQDEIYKCGRGQAQKNIDIDSFKSLLIPVPPVKTQEDIVNQIEFERALVESNKRLAESYTLRMKNIIAKLWEH